MNNEHLHSLGLFDLKLQPPCMLSNYQVAMIYPFHLACDRTMTPDPLVPPGLPFVHAEPIHALSITLMSSCTKTRSSPFPRLLACSSNHSQRD